MASSPSSSLSGSSASNPFADSPPRAIAASTLQHVNIRTHVPIVLDYDESNFSIWCSFFDATLRKFGLLNHVDGSVDARAMWHNTDWLQVDQCIVSWLYTSISPAMMKMVQVPDPTVYVIWSKIRGLFLDNADQHAIYTLQEFHSLFQGDLSIHDYFGRLKQLGDLLCDVGHPISEPSMVVNALRSLRSKFSHAIPVITSFKPLPSFQFVFNYLLQDENRQEHTTKMEANMALLAAAANIAMTGAPPATGTGSR